MSQVKKLWWPLRSQSRFVTVTATSWAVIGGVIVAALQLEHSGSVRALETAFGIFGGGLAGLLWSVVMWQLVLKNRVQRILAAEAAADRAEA